MKTSQSRILAICLLGALVSVPLALLTPVALAEESPEPTAPPKGEAVVATVQATATVTAIDLATRQVTLRTSDGEELRLVVDEAARNLPQVTVGDLIEVTYTEALAYEVKKGGKADLAAGVTVGGAEPGAKPAGLVGQEVTLTAVIVAIDPEVPSVTLEGPEGDTHTIEVRHPEQLEGVKVGDTVEITYVEAVVLEVEKAPHE